MSRASELFLCAFLFMFLSIPALAFAAETSLTIASDARDSLGQGRFYSYSVTDGFFSAERSSSNIVSVLFTGLGDLWHLYLAAPNNSELTVGTYQGTRDAFNPGSAPGMRISNGFICDASGSFEIKEISYGANNEVLSLWATFEQVCQSSPQAVLQGEIKFNASAPNSTTTLQTSLNPSAAGQNVTLTAHVSGTSGYPTGTVTFKNGSAILGTADLSGYPAAASATFSTSMLTEGVHSITAEYSGDTKLALSKSAHIVNQKVEKKGATVLLMHSDGTEWIGQGKFYFYTLEDGIFDAKRNSLNGVSLSFKRANLWWSISFAAPNNAALTVGTYNGTILYPINPPLNAPGMEISGDGRGCGYQASGSFEVKEIVYGAGTDIQSFWATFEQYCDGSPIPLMGEIRFSATIPDSSVTISSSANPSNNQPVTLTANVGSAGSIPTGEVWFVEGNTVIAKASLSGNPASATVDFALLAGGRHLIKAVYMGDGSHHSMISPVFSQRVIVNQAGAEWTYLPGNSTARGVSADGSVVVGWTYNSEGHARAFRWSETDGMVELGTLGGLESIALGVSADGNVIVGRAADTLGQSRAFRWTQADGMIDLGTLGGTSSEAYSASSDGSVIVGWSHDATNVYRAFRWVQSGGMSDIGAGPYSNATGVSADGLIIAGSGGTQAFRWTQGTGSEHIGSWTYSFATGISADGQVVIGEGNVSNPNDSQRSFLWTQVRGMEDLGVFSGSPATWYPSEAYGVSASGNVVVGYASYFNAAGNWRGYRWSQAGGMQTINQWLEDTGLDASAVEFYSVHGVSADGGTVVGSSSGGAFRARVVPGMHFLTAYTSGMGSGSLTSTSLGVTCSGGSCSGSWNQTANATITANSGIGSHLAGWTGCDSVEGNNCIVSIMSSKRVMATFERNKYSLTAQADGDGGGLVQSNTRRIVFNYPSANVASEIIPHGSSLMLVAASSLGSTVSWSGCDSVTGSAVLSTCSVLATAIKTARATFTLNQYSLTYTAGQNGSLSGTAFQTVKHGSNGTAVRAVPAFGFHFVQWSDGVSTNPRTDVNVTGSINASAIFAVSPQYTLTVTATGGGSGSVTSNVGGINYTYPAGNSASAQIYYETTVTLTAFSANSVAGWTGACDATGGTPMNATCTINNMNGNKTVAAAFIPCTYNIASSYSTVAPAGGVQNVSTSASNAGCAWTAVSNAPWISITSGISGSGNGNIQFSVAPNPGSVRTGAVTIAGKTFTVVQGTTSTFVPLGVYAAGMWYMDLNGNGTWNGESLDTSYFFGFEGAVPVAGDWDGMGIRRIGVYSNGYWYLDMNDNGAWDGEPTDLHRYFGFAGAVPVTGDWNNNGQANIGVYFSGLWYLDMNGNGIWDGEPNDKICHFGFAGATPVVGDWNGNGGSKVGVYYNGYWYLDLDGNCSWSAASDVQRHFGFVGALPITGDWNSTGQTNIGVYSDGRWYLDLNGNGEWDGTGTDALYFFGFPGALPVPGGR